MIRDHEHARILGEEAVKHGWSLTLPIDTNMVWLDGRMILQRRGWSSKALEDYFLHRWGIRVGGMDAQGNMRCVLHHQVTPEDVDLMIKALKGLVK